MRKTPVVAALVVALAAAGIVLARSGSAATGGPVVRQVDVGGHPVTVVVSPGRPGRNLVQAVSPHGIDVEGDGPVDLPPGGSTLHLSVGPRSVDVPVDVAGPVSRSVDEECASRQLARSLAGRDAGGCDTSPGDESAIAAALVRYVRGPVVVWSDESPRGQAALRGALAAAGDRARTDARPPTAEEALLVLGSWDQARSAVASTAPGRGIVLAPWLLEPGALGPARTQITVASTLSPSSGIAAHYLAALADRAPGVPPSEAGLEAFAGSSGARRLQLWSPANLAFLPRVFNSAGHDHAHGSTWTPEGSLALVRSALPY
jgi:hypothetical protein